MTLQSLIQTFKDSIAQSNLLMELTTEYIIVCMSVALACAAIIYLVYFLFYRGACYSDNFAVLLVMTTLITSMIIVTISANIVLSLGMVGALSIVRFRAAVKDPLDVGFLFWSIAAGLTCGAGLYMFALTGTIFVAAVYVLTIFLRGRVATYLLVVRFADGAKQGIDTALTGVKYKLKGSTKTAGSTELTIQLKLKKEQRDLTDKLAAVEGVASAILVEYTGDI
jgi:Uncharacterized membrane protein